MDLMATAQLLGNFGEFIGAIAVVVTLAYLTVQVRQTRRATEINTEALRNAASAQQASTFIELTRPIYENLEVAPFMLRLAGATSMEALSAEDRLRAVYYVSANFKAGEHNYNQWIGGHLSDGEWESVEAGGRAFVQAAPIIAEVWNTGARKGFSPRFAEHRDGVVGEAVT